MKITEMLTSVNLFFLFQSHGYQKKNKNKDSDLSKSDGSSILYYHTVLWNSSMPSHFLKNGYRPHLNIPELPCKRKVGLFALFLKGPRRHLQIMMHNVAGVSTLWSDVCGTNISSCFMLTREMHVSFLHNHSNTRSKLKSRHSHTPHWRSR